MKGILSVSPLSLQGSVSRLEALQAAVSDPVFSLRILQPGVLHVLLSLLSDLPTPRQPFFALLRGVHFLERLENSSLGLRQHVHHIVKPAKQIPTVSASCSCKSDLKMFLIFFHEVWSSLSPFYSILLVHLICRYLQYLTSPAFSLRSAHHAGQESFWSAKPDDCV